MNKLKIAIIGAGVAGLSCAIECEKLGVPAEVFERHHSVGWPWPSVNNWLDIFTRVYGSNPIKYIKDMYDINIKPSFDEKNFIMKSSNSETKIQGKLGPSFYRGKEVDCIENQLLRELKKTPVHYNALSNYKELSQKYDYVVVATGRDFEAKELGVWEEQGRVSIMGTIALGSFAYDTSTIYFDTEYAGTGYARVSPYSDTQAVIALYVIGKGDYNTQQLDVNRGFERFLEKERLDKLELMYRFIKPPFSTGRVSGFKSANVLLTGRSAGLTDRLLGTGAIEAIISGVFAARAIINREDYDELLKPLQKHIENISALRNYVENFSNDDFDSMVSLLRTPGIKQLIYNTSLNLPDIVGGFLSKYQDALPG